MDNNEIKEEVVVDALSKHCDVSDCAMYMLPQPKRTYCIECGSVLIY